MGKLSHIDENNRPSMVDVGDKTATRREARARSVVILPAAVLAALDGDEINTKKGPVFATAIIAGVMAAKKTHELIPFCHPLGLENCKITISIGGDTGNEAIIECTCRVHHKTGVEMEALTGASVAALTIYDMCKALSHDIVIANTRLLSKSGGKQDFQHVD
jgi:cyclic pyranopterin phosphate synthase